MAHWKARVQFLLSVIELLFLSLTVEALQGKMCRNSLPSGGGRSLGAPTQGEHPPKETENLLQFSYFWKEKGRVEGKYLSNIFPPPLSFCHTLFFPFPFLQWKNFSVIRSITKAVSNSSINKSQNKKIVVDFLFPLAIQPMKSSASELRSGLCPQTPSLLLCLGWNKILATALTFITCHYEVYYLMAVSGSDWWPSAILDLLCACLGHPWRVFGGVCHCAKFG